MNAQTTAAPGRVSHSAAKPARLGEEFTTHQRELETFYDRFAEVLAGKERHAGYHGAIARLAKHYIAPGLRVLEVGSGTGDLLSALQPSNGYGVDISGGMVKLAAARHPELRFRHMPAEQLDLDGEQVDAVLLSDLIGEVYDIRQVFERIRRVCKPNTRIVLHWYSRLWQPVLGLAEQFGLKYPRAMVNWTTVEDITNLLHLAGFEVVHRRPQILLPVQIPLLTRLANRYLAHLPGLRWLCLTNWIVARPIGLPPAAALPKVSVICPCRNEAGTIESIAQRVPQMGASTELIFVEGHSKDDTLAECHRVIARMPEKDMKVVVQQGIGKGDAVRLGFAQATGDVLMILDADLGVVPEDLPQFYEALVEGTGEMINGSRLVYMMDKRAMRFLNLLGNRFFAWLLSGLLGQPVKDTLCGTKVLWRRDYERVTDTLRAMGSPDPFGDFDLLFGAAALHLRILEVPIRYRERLYGATNIRRFSDGWTLLKMCGRAAKHFYFVG